MNKIEKIETSGAMIVSWDFSNDDPENYVAIVGSKTPRKDLEIINAFQGKEAYELVKKLVLGGNI